MSNIIETENLTKFYGSARGIDSLALTVREVYRVEDAERAGCAGLGGRSLFLESLLSGPRGRKGKNCGAACADRARHDKGTGLGLASVKSLMEKTGGSASAALEGEILTISLDFKNP